VTPKIAEIINDQTASVWLKLALLSAMNRDPVDAAYDAEGLRNTLKGQHDLKDMLGDFAVSFWVKDYLRRALERDPVDAATDAEALAAALRERCDTVLKQDEHLLRGSDHV
jgi:hypothetical protein